jgi:hypothetical protein
MTVVVDAHRLTANRNIWIICGVRKFKRILDPADGAYGIPYAHKMRTAGPRRERLLEFACKIKNSVGVLLLDCQHHADGIGHQRLITRRDKAVHVQERRNCAYRIGATAEPEQEHSVALIEMIHEVNVGIKFDKARTDLVLGGGGGAYARPDANAKMHNSLTGPWWPAEFVLKKHYDRTTRKTSRRMNLFRRRTIDPGASIHESVYQRAGYASDLPPGVQRVSTLPLP